MSFGAVLALRIKAHGIGPDGTGSFVYLSTARRRVFLY